MDLPPSSLVLLHGFASSFEHGWQESGWVDILADFGCAAAPIDLPGHGSSTTGSDPSSYDTVAEDVFADLPQPTGAVGFSAGAEILLRIAAAHPGCFDRLVLLGVGDNVFEPSDPTRLAAALEGDAEPEDIQARLFYRMAVSSGNDPASLAAFLRRRREPLRDEELSVVTCPVLVVLGDRDMTTTADRLVAALPSSTLVSVPGVDHFATPTDFGVIDATMKFFGFA
jgi:pimeloyl-ACP methyl ester carboxylesterase